jgi:hypothetical protein
MTEYLPEVYQQFERRYPALKEAFDALGAAEHDAGPLGERERRLIKLGIVVGAQRAVCVRTCASCSVSGSPRRRFFIPSSSLSPPSDSLLPTRP